MSNNNQADEIEEVREHPMLFRSWAKHEMITFKLVPYGEPCVLYDAPYGYFTDLDFPESGLFFKGAKIFKTGNKEDNPAFFSDVIYSVDCIDGDELMTNGNHLVQPLKKECSLNVENLEFSSPYNDIKQQKWSK